MLSSAELKTCTLTNTTVETEIALLNLNILAVGNSTTVTVNVNTETVVNGVTVTGTPMSVAGDYYSAWQGIVTDNFKTSEMQKVIDYFTKLGYTISRKSEDMEHLFWTISW